MLTELGHAVERGALDIPRMAGEGLQYLGEATGSDALKNAGTSVTSGVDQFMKDHPSLQASPEAQNGGPWSLHSALSQGGQMASSAMGLPLAGAAIGTVVPGVGTALGFTAGEILSLPLFFGSAAQTTYNKVRAAAKSRGLSDKAADALAIKKGAESGAIMASGMFALQAITGGASRLVPIRLLPKSLVDALPGKAKEDVAKASIKALRSPMDYLKTVAKDFTGAATVVGGQQLGIQKVEASAGAAPEPKLSDLKSMVLPTAVMSLLTAGGAETVGAMKRARASSLLADANAKPQARIRAAQAVAGEISVHDKDVAKAFLRDAASRIAQKKPVIMLTDEEYRANQAQAGTDQGAAQPTAGDVEAEATKADPGNPAAAAQDLPDAGEPGAEPNVLGGNASGARNWFEHDKFMGTGGEDVPGAGETYTGTDLLKTAPTEGSTPLGGHGSGARNLDEHVDRLLSGAQAEQEHVLRQRLQSLNEQMDQAQSDQRPEMAAVVQQLSGQRYHILQQLRAIAPNYVDPRLKREVYRDALTDSAARDLVEGGGISTILDDLDRVVRRTPSVHQPWVQSLLADTKLSVKQIRAAVDKAIKGERLGARQTDAVRQMLDQITADRTHPDNIRAAQEAADLRRMVGMFGPFSEQPDWLMPEEAYEPDMSASGRVLMELAEKARSLGDETADQVEHILERGALQQLPDAAVAAQLQDLIRQTTGEETQGGAARPEQQQPAGAEAIPPQPAGEQTGGLRGPAAGDEQFGLQRSPGAGQPGAAGGSPQEVAPAHDLFGPAPTAEQAHHDAMMAANTALGSEHVPVESGAGDLFSGKSKQTDLEDVTGKPSTEKPKPAENPGAKRPAKGHELEFEKRKATIDGMRVAVEKRERSINQWRAKPHHRGEIIAVMRHDIEPADVILGPLAPKAGFAAGSPELTHAWVFDLVDPKTADFVGHKVLLGFRNEEKARGALEAYHEPAEVGAVHQVTIEALKKWLASRDTGRPFKRLSAASETPKPAKKPNPVRKKAQPESKAESDQHTKITPADLERYAVKRIRENIDKLKPEERARKAVSEVESTDHAIDALWQDHPALKNRRQDVEAYKQFVEARKGVDYGKIRKEIIGQRDIPTFSEDAAKSLAAREWNGMPVSERMEVVRRAGWETRGLRVSRVGQGIAKTPWEALTPAARNVLQNKHADWGSFKKPAPEKVEKPTAKRPKLKQSTETQKAHADLDAALADLGDILGKGSTKHIVPPDESKLLPVLARVLDAAFRLGYHKFKDAARFALETIRSKLGDEAADAINLDHLQGAYIAMAGKYQDKGADHKKAVVGVDSLDEVMSPQSGESAKVSGEENANAAGRNPNLEPDRAAAGNAGPGNEAPVRNGPEGNGPGAGAAGAEAGGAGVSGRGGESVSGRGAAAAGTRGNPGIPRQDGTFGSEAGASGAPHSERGAADGSEGVQPDRETSDPPEAVARQDTDSLEARVERQAKADKVPVKPGDLQNIRDTLPVLLPQQQEDVHFAEQRFHVVNGRGVMFTNGTGTGKTFSGLGIAKRFDRQGKSNILIAVPGEKVAADWIKSARHLGLTVTQLRDTKDAGRGIVVTTYANVGDNSELAKRNWDLILTDEAHRLSENKDGESTLALAAIRALSAHPRGLFRYTEMMHPDIMERIRAAQEAIDAGGGEKYLEARTKAFQDLQAAREALAPDYERRWQEGKTKVTYLSATPFAYDKNVDYAEGYLFDYPPENKDTVGGWSHVSPHDEFFVQHFGYRIRYGKLTQPEAEVDRDLMARQFNSWLKQQGVLSGRRLNVDKDYGRQFVAVDDLVGRKIDEGMDWLREHAWNRENELAPGFQAMLDQLKEQFTYHDRMRLLEAIKAKHAVERAREHLAMGRKVVIFHSRIKGGGRHPFHFVERPFPSDEEIQRIADDKGVTPEVVREQYHLYNEAVRAFNSERPDLVNLDLSSLIRPLTLFEHEFGDRVTFYNGTISKRLKRENPDRFNQDTSGVDVIVVQDEGGKEGISLHDTTGKHQRVLMNLGLPIKPTQAIQIEGRIYRVGQMSNAVFEYFNTGTNFEKYTFASAIAQRASMAENLALGEEARGLREAFVQAFEDATDTPPSDEQGTGGKEADMALTTAITPFEQAKTFYWANRKKKSGRANREGVDYFATPEPLGLKMVEWAGIRPGEDAMEPSAGHGAIARFFPGNSNNLFIEPESELMSRINLRATGATRQIRFESLDVGGNKQDVIVMNPPFGQGGKTAVDHLSKAMRHLREGGRIVALLPSGPAADKRLERLLYGTDGELELLRQKVKNGTVSQSEYDHRRAELQQFHLTADIKLPGVAFERAGTNAATHIVVLDHYRPEKVKNSQPGVRRDISADNIKELFDRIENMGVPDRPVVDVGTGKPLETAPEMDAGDAQSVLDKHGLKVKATQTAGGTDVWEVSGNTKLYKTILGAKSRGGLGGKWYGPKGVWSFYDGDPSAKIAAEIQRGHGETGTHEASALYSGYERTPSNLQIRERDEAVRQPAPAAGRGQLDLFGTEGLPEQTARHQLADNFEVRYKQVPVGHFNVGFDRIHTPEEAAHVVAQLRKHGQESFLTVVTGADGKILNVIRHTKGVKDGASVDPVTVAAAVAATPGAENVWFAHNHPSGVSSPSRADYHLTGKLAQALDGSGINFEGHIVLGRGREATFFTGTANQRRIEIAAAPQRQTVPITERVIRKQPPDLRQTFGQPADTLNFVKSLKTQNGVLLLDTRNQLAGIVALTDSEMNRLRETGTVRRVLSAIDATNALNAIPFGDSAKGVENTANFLKNTNMRVLDGVVREPDGQYSSLAERGRIDEPARPFLARTTPSEAGDRPIAAWDPDGTIAKAAGREPGPIVLTAGEDSNAEGGNRYGIEHVLNGHGPAISDRGHADVADYVNHVLQNATEIRRTRTASLMVVADEGRGAPDAVMLQPTEQHGKTVYVVETAGPWRGKQLKAFRELWSRSQEDAVVPRPRRLPPDAISGNDLLQPAKSTVKLRQGQPERSGQQVESVKSQASELTRGWAKAPDIHVVQSPDELPARVRGEVDTQNAGGAAGEASAAFDPSTQSIYLVADNLPSREAVERAVLHEGFHVGLRSLFGKDIVPLLDQVYMGNADTIRRTAARYGADLTTKNGRRLATEEYLASIAESGQRPKLLQRVIATLRGLLRKMGFKVQYSDAEMRQLVAQVGQHNREGAPHVALVDAPAMQRRPYGRPLGIPKGFYEQGYPHAYEVRVTWPDGESIIDGIKGLNQGHARYLAEQNWPGAKIEMGPEVDAAHPRLSDAPLLQRREPTGDEHLDSLLSKIGALRATLWQRIKNWLHSGVIDRFTQANLDKFYGLRRALQDVGTDPMAADSSYIAARMSTSTESQTLVAMVRGPLEWDGNRATVAKDGKGLIDILRPVADKLDLWEAWMVAKRAERLKAEGRENLLSDEEIAAGKKLGEENPDFQKVADDWAEFNSKTLDFAEKAGLIDAEDRATWENADYIPFYRITSEPVDTRPRGPKGRGGLSHQNSGIRRLVGGTENINDPLANILLNTSHLIDASMKNHAVRMAVDELEGSDLVNKAPYEFKPELIPKGQIKKILAANGVDPEELPPSVFRGIEKMFAMKAPMGKNVVRVMVGGKPKYYEVHDPLLLRSLTNINQAQLGEFMKLFRGPKRWLTTMVTADPAFQVANFLRDTLSAFVLGRDNVVPIASAIHGATQALKKDDSYWEMLAAGGGFHSGFLNASDPNASSRIIKAQLRRKGFRHTVLDTPQKVWDAWKEFGSAIENANRLAVYNGALKAGKDKLAAAFEAKDLMDFSMRGDGHIYQFLAGSVPFLNARVQGLYRLGRGARENPGAFAARGMLITMASLGLWYINKDDKRWQQLEDWDKDTYWHFWLSDKPDAPHFRLPKPFEVGVVFGTIPERLFGALYSNSPDRWQKLMDRIGWNIWQVFNVGQLPQTIAPIAEQVANKSFFTGRPIVGMNLQGLEPSAQFNPWTHETSIQIGRELGLSPVRIDAFLQGYFGTIGGYALSASDAVVRKLWGYPVRPELRADQIPVLGRFLRDAPPQGTQFATDFYDLIGQLQATAATIRRYQKLGDRKQSMATYQQAGPELSLLKPLQGVNGQIQQINNQIRQITLSREIGAKQKRRLIDELTQRKNDLYEQSMEAANRVRRRMAR